MDPASHRLPEVSLAKLVLSRSSARRRAASRPSFPRPRDRPSATPPPRRPLPQNQRHHRTLPTRRSHGCPTWLRPHACEPSALPPCPYARCTTLSPFPLFKSWPAPPSSASSRSRSSVPRCFLRSPNHPPRHNPQNDGRPQPCRNFRRPPSRCQATSILPVFPQCPPPCRLPLFLHRTSRHRRRTARS